MTGHITGHVLTRRSAIAASLGTALAGCTNPRLLDSPPLAPTNEFTHLKPLDLRPENLIKLTVCTRPLRPAGPRLEAETIGGKTIVHNYGHGGSGWSLAWGYAEEARDIAAASRPSSVAVVGAGAIGLTTAISLAETGAKVTIFARELPMESNSTRATGVWSPAWFSATVSAHHANNT